MARIRFPNRVPPAPVPTKKVRAAQKKLKTAIQKESDNILKLYQTILDAVKELEATQKRVFGVDPKRIAFQTSGLSLGNQHFPIPLLSVNNLNHILSCIKESSKGIKELLAKKKKK
jgi:hypothetical protein